MAQEVKKTSKELLEVEICLSELERASAYLQKEFYHERKTQLIEREEVLLRKLNRGELAPDIQYIITEVEG
jgi:hypothetical protein